MAEAPISFARGAPAPELIPAAELADCVHAVALREGAPLFSYGPGGGYAPLREWVADRHGVDVGRVVLTVGGLLGFVLYASEMLERRPGRVLVESPSYDRPLRVLERADAEIVAVPMDDEGLDPDALDAELRRRSDPPSFLYTIPTFQNPSGRTLTAERRQRIAELLTAHGVPALEDDPYGLVRFEGERAAVAPRARGRSARHVHVVVLQDRGAGPAHGLLRPPRPRMPPSSRRGSCPPTSHRRSWCRRRSRS